MARTRKKSPRPEALPYGTNPDIVVAYELPWGDDVIRPPDKIKFKNIIGWFEFIKVAHNSKLDATWIDCKDVNTGEFRSFHVHKLKEVSRPKKSRAKKNSV